MRNNLENNSAMLKSVEPLSGSTDSLKGNQNFQSLEQLNYRRKEQKIQNELHGKIDEKEHEKADIDLENEISNLKVIKTDNLKMFIDVNYFGNGKIFDFANKYLNRQNDLGRNLTENELKKYLDKEFESETNVSTADQIKNYKEELTKQGKPQTEILSLLISKFENNEAVSTWVKNWRNFQKLHNFAENKPPAERQAIQNIVAKADFTNETAFENPLAEIAQSTEISNETKFEISREFGGANIKSVGGMDYQLKEIKSHTKAIEKEIDVKSSEKKSLDSEIENLEDELDSLSLDDPKRQELEEKIEQKKEDLEQTEKEIDRLEKGKPKETSFVLREGFSAIQNPDGSRSIKIDSVDFAIKLPSNKWLFSDMKNMRAINLAFPFVALKKQNLANFLFRPNLENNAVSSIENRKMGHLILSSLGYDDSKILSEENIKQLSKDLSILNPDNGKTGEENLIALGVFDVGSQSLDRTRLKEVLKKIRENSGLKSELVFEKLKLN